LLYTFKLTNSKINYNKNCFYLLSFLLELLDGSLVDAAALVDEMAGGGRLAGVDVTDDDNVDVNLLLRHVERSVTSGR
jgi:hypothetical protein